jgi:hypothetical protein
MENTNETAAVGFYNKPKLTPVFETFKKAVKTWWQNLDKILKIYWEGIKPTLAPLAVAAILGILAVVLTKNHAVSTGLKVAGALAAAVVVVMAIYFWTRAYIGIFLLVKKNYQDEAVETYKETKQLFWRYIGLSLLTGLLVLLWALLLIIPGIIFAFIYSFAIYALFFEDKRGMAAISRSKEIIKGYFWPVVGRLFFLGLATWLLMLILAAPLAGMPENSLVAQAWNFIVQIISWLIGPIALIYTYSIYTDLIKVKKQ